MKQNDTMQKLSWTFSSYYVVKLQTFILQVHFKLFKIYQQRSFMVEDKWNVTLPVGDCALNDDSLLDSSK